MMWIKKLFTHILIGGFLFFSSASVYAECLVFPPVCPIEMCGYQTQESPTQQVVQKGVSAYKTTKGVIKTARRIQSKAMSLATSVVTKTTSLVASIVSLPFKALGNLLGLTKSANEEDTESVTQDNSHGDISVEQRIYRDLKTFTTESNADAEWQSFNKKRRNYIRQQATISLMAYALVLKSYLEDIGTIMEAVKNTVEKSSQESAKSAEDSANYNEADLVQINYDLHEAWFKLLAIQKFVEAVRLESAANQAIAGMPSMKTVPEITTSNQTGGSK